MYFPDRFDDVSVREFYDVLKRRTVLLLRSIVDGVEDAEIDRLTDLIMTYSKPAVFSGNENSEIQYDKQFETMCLVLSEQFHVQPKGFTVLEFYNAYEQLLKLQKEREKALKRK